MNTTAERIGRCVELTEDWSLWRDFAVRSSGFPVEGLDRFGPDEDARLAEVARDPAFREAVAWQSRESLARAVDKLAAGSPGSPSRRRRWTDVVAAYWRRAQIGRLVVRRASWSAAAGELPDDLAGWARDRGVPRRVFVRSPLERKPRYVDFESPALRRILARFLAPAREQAPGARVEFTEMLPGLEDCWLASEAGHHTSELRIVALDRR